MNFSYHCGNVGRIVAFFVLLVDIKPSFYEAPDYSNVAADACLQSSQSISQQMKGADEG